MLAATPGHSHVHADMSSQHQSVPSPLTCALLGLLCPHAQRDNRGGAWTSGRYDELRKQVEIASAELAVSHHIVDSIIDIIINVIDTVPPVTIGFPNCQSPKWRLGFKYWVSCLAMHGVSHAHGPGCGKGASFVLLFAYDISKGCTLEPL